MSTFTCDKHNANIISENDLWSSKLKLPLEQKLHVWKLCPKSDPEVYIEMSARKVFIKSKQLLH